MLEAFGQSQVPSPVCLPIFPGILKVPVGGIAQPLFVARYPSFKAFRHSCMGYSSRRDTDAKFYRPHVLAIRRLDSTYSLPHSESRMVPILQFSRRKGYH